MSSEAISIVIEQPFDEVYRFLVDPLNFPSWGPPQTSDMRHLGGGDWLVDFQRGPMILRFTEPNLYGVLDYRIFRPGDAPGHLVSVRLLALGEACELTMIWRQRPGVSHEHFTAEGQAIRGYFARLKALLEAKPAD
jgi:hypothetical protein